MSSQLSSGSDFIVMIIDFVDVYVYFYLLFSYKILSIVDLMFCISMALQYICNIKLSILGFQFFSCFYVEILYSYYNDCKQFCGWFLRNIYSASK